MTTNTLPHSFVLRAAMMSDIEAVTELYATCGRIEYTPTEDYVPDWTIDDLRSDWQELNLATDAWVVIAPNGRLVGYTDVRTFTANVERTERQVSINFYAFEHPDYQGYGIGATLLQAAEERALQLIPEGPFVAATWAGHSHKAVISLLESAGFIATGNTVQEMKIKFTTPPPQPQWPTDITVRSFIPQQDDEAVKDTIEEAFEQPFSHWKSLYVNRANFDPTLWHVALHNDEVVGVLLSTPNPNMGYVDMLGVRKAWRKRGLAKALLLHAFGDYYSRDYRLAALSVNTKNVTGATQLYERVGMYVSHRIEAYQKKLR